MKMAQKCCHSMDTDRWKMFVMGCMVNDVTYYMNLRLLWMIENKLKEKCEIFSSRLRFHWNKASFKITLLTSDTQ